MKVFSSSSSNDRGSLSLMIVLLLLLVHVSFGDDNVVDGHDHDNVPPSPSIDCYTSLDSISMKELEISIHRRNVSKIPWAEIVVENSHDEVEAEKWEAIESHVPSKRRYVLCPHTIFYIGTPLDDDPTNDDAFYVYEGGSIPLLVINPNLEITCGEDGNPKNNCTLLGGEYQVVSSKVLMPPALRSMTYHVNPTNFTMRGVTLHGSSYRSIQMGELGQDYGILFQNCIFENQIQGNYVVFVQTIGNNIYDTMQDAAVIAAGQAEVAKEEEEQESEGEDTRRGRRRLRRLGGGGRHTAAAAVQPRLRSIRNLQDQGDAVPVGTIGAPGVGLPEVTLPPEETQPPREDGGGGDGGEGDDQPAPAESGGEDGGTSGAPGVESPPEETQEDGGGDETTTEEGGGGDESSPESNSEGGDDQPDDTPASTLGEPEEEPTEGAEEGSGEEGENPTETTTTQEEGGEQPTTEGAEEGGTEEGGTEEGGTEEGGTEEGGEQPTTEGAEEATEATTPEEGGEEDPTTEGGEEGSGEGGEDPTTEGGEEGSGEGEEDPTETTTTTPPPEEGGGEGGEDPTTTTTPAEGEGEAPEDGGEEEEGTDDASTTVGESEPTTPEAQEQANTLGDVVDDVEEAAKEQETEAPITTTETTSATTSPPHSSEIPMNPLAGMTTAEFVTSATSNLLEITFDGCIFRNNRVQVAVLGSNDAVEIYLTNNIFYNNTIHSIETNEDDENEDDENENDDEEYQEVGSVIMFNDPLPSLYLESNCFLYNTYALSPILLEHGSLSKEGFDELELSENVNENYVHEDTIMMELNQTTTSTSSSCPNQMLIVAPNQDDLLIMESNSLFERLQRGAFSCVDMDIRSECLSSIFTTDMMIDPRKEEVTTTDSDNTSEDEEKNENDSSSNNDTVKVAVISSTACFLCLVITCLCWNNVRQQKAERDEYMNRVLQDHQSSPYSSRNIT